MKKIVGHIIQIDTGKKFPTRVYFKPEEKRAAEYWVTRKQYDGCRVVSGVETLYADIEQGKKRSRK